MSHYTAPEIAEIRRQQALANRNDSFDFLPARGPARALAIRQLFREKVMSFDDVAGTWLSDCGLEVRVVMSRIELSEAQMVALYRYLDLTPEEACQVHIDDAQGFLNSFRTSTPEAMRAGMDVELEARLENLRATQEDIRLGRIAPTRGLC
jgi:hypothetical protein